MDGPGLLYGLMIDSDRLIKDTIWAVTIHKYESGVFVDRCQLSGRALVA